MSRRVSVTKAAVNKGYGFEHILKKHPELIGDTPYWFPPRAVRKRKEASGGKKTTTRRKRGGSYNMASLLGGSYDDAALLGGSYDDAALLGGAFDPSLISDAFKNLGDGASSAATNAILNVLGEVGSNITGETLTNLGKSGWQKIKEWFTKSKRKREEEKKKRMIVQLLLQMKQTNPEQFNKYVKMLQEKKKRENVAAMRRALGLDDSLALDLAPTSSTTTTTQTANNNNMAPIQPGLLL